MSQRPYEDGTRQSHFRHFLCRTNWIGGFRNLGMFKSRLKATLLGNERDALSDFDTRVQVETVHRFKGKEADVVIVLDATEGRFPLLHPDTELMRFFGETNQLALEDERRLFYVAVTRPTTDLYLVSRRDRESPFSTGSDLTRHEIDPLDRRYRASTLDPGLAELLVLGRGTYSVHEVLKKRGYIWRKERTAWMRILRRSDISAEMSFVDGLRASAAPPDLRAKLLSDFESEGSGVQQSLSARAQYRPDEDEIEC